ncbi:MAG: hypothetical protein IKI28_06900 [Bacteroidales bacterium]|nr:hypothetical protein [Bacteroidales bacterium]
MKRIAIIMLLSLFSLAACTVNDLSSVFDEPITDENGVIIDRYPYLWARLHNADSTGTTARVEFRTYDYSLPVFNNGGKVIVGNIYGGITCLETDGGKVVWTCKMTDDFFTKSILDYIIASNEEWIILNMDGEFIKVDLKEGKVLAKCTIASHAKSRMYRDGDICFYLSGRSNVYRVGCTNLIAHVDETFDDTKIYEHVAIIPYTRNNESYRFIQEVTMGTGGYNVKLYLLPDNMGSNDTLYVSLLTKQHNVEYLENIDEYNGEVYLFKSYGFDVFDWENKEVIHQYKYASEMTYWFHEFHNDKLVFHIYKGSFYDMFYDMMFMMFDVNNKTSATGYVGSREIYGAKSFDGYAYISRNNRLKIYHFDNSGIVLNINLSQKNPNSVSGTTAVKDVYHEFAVFKNAVGKTIVVIATDDMVFCYSGL